ncbi:hypothetical protein L1987_07333 [Smallanthus sonchifolius]|uniref:Uncharacterized protein n=1 Tax=Smallanthus sonchifolius TaxID=185202 RepID=A0ACB9K090_9ASTR|nr:hypothetical protein L1987_07333 [Smallanthus sonchifolius]
MFHATKDEHLQSFLSLKQKPSSSISNCCFVFGYSSTATTRHAIGFICYFECLRYKIHPFDLYPERLRLQANGGIKQNVAHRQNRQLVLVDEDDDDEDDEIFQADVDENDEYEIHGDDSDKDLENEDDVLVEEQLEGHELEKAIEVSKSKKRGPTMMHAVHTRKLNECEIIICNEFGQPIGLVTEEKDIVEKFSQFLGTIARNHSYASLIHNSWHKMPHKDKIWEYVMEKYDVPDTARTWVLRTIGSSYKALLEFPQTNINLNDGPTSHSLEKTLAAN